LLKAENDPLHGVKRGMRYLRVGFYTGIAQMMLFFAGFVYVLINVKIP
jgi:hypothetical protein